MTARKAIFDWFRRVRGKGYSPAEVRELDSLFDAYDAVIRMAGDMVLAETKVPESGDGWMAFAVPLVCYLYIAHFGVSGHRVR